MRNLRKKFSLRLLSLFAIGITLFGEIGCGNQGNEQVSANSETTTNIVASFDGSGAGAPAQTMTPYDFKVVVTDLMSPSPSGRAFVESGSSSNACGDVQKPLIVDLDGNPLQQDIPLCDTFTGGVAKTVEIFAFPAAATISSTDFLNAATGTGSIQGEKQVLIKMSLPLAAAKKGGGLGSLLSGLGPLMDLLNNLGSGNTALACQIADGLKSFTQCDPNGTVCCLIESTTGCKATNSTCGSGGGGTCGNGQSDPGEQCDPSTSGGQSDADFSCSKMISGSHCNANTCLCEGGSTGSCGNGKIDAGEDCDPNLICEVGQPCPACHTPDFVCAMPGSQDQCHCVASGGGSCVDLGLQNCGEGGLCPGGMVCDSQDNCCKCSGDPCKEGTCNSGFICENNCCVVIGAAGCGDGLCRPDLCERASTDPGCQADCHCGNGKLEPELGEECDDGNLIDGDGCSDICKVDHTCGNGIVEAGEFCDPPQSPILFDNGNPVPPGNCCTRFCDGGAPCHPQVCGDGLCDGPPLETPSNCPQDCDTCGDGLCTGNELLVPSLCPEDCGACSG